MSREETTINLPGEKENPNKKKLLRRAGYKSTKKIVLKKGVQTPNCLPLLTIINGFNQLPYFN
jgi:hypothetical protein